MRPLPVLAATASAAVIAGLAVAAQTPAARSHTLTVQLPGGGVETITYAGDVAPQVSVAPAGVAFAPAPVFVPMFAPPIFADGAMESPFAMMRRISAEMDRQAGAMFAQAGVAQAGARGFSFASSLSGSGVCLRSVQITSAGDGRAPKVVSRTSGDCAAAPAPTGGGAAATALPRAEAPADGPRYYQTAWRPAARPQATDATLRTVSRIAD